MAPGKDYSLRMNSTVNLYRNSAGVTYPYTVGSMISITRSSATAAGYYYYFYNWQVQANPCISDRVPVTATVTTPCSTGIAGNGADNGLFNIYPNPALNTLVIEKNGGEPGMLVVELVNLIGEKMYSSTIENSNGTFKKTLNIENVPAGIYFVYINSSDKYWVYKLAKQ